MATLYEVILPEVIQEIYEVPDFVAINAIRKSAIEFCRRSECYRQEVKFLTLPDTTTYALSVPSETKLCNIYDAKLSYNGYALEMRTDAQLDTLDPAWILEYTAKDFEYLTQDDETQNSVRIVPYPREADEDNGQACTVTSATPVSLEVTGHGYVTGDVVSVHGTGESIDDTSYYIVKTDADNFTLTGTVAGDAGASTGYVLPQYEVAVQTALQPLASSTGIADHIYQDYYESIATGALARLYAMPSKGWANPTYAQAFFSAFESAIIEAKRRIENQNTDITRVIQYGGI